MGADDSASVGVLSERINEIFNGGGAEDDIVRIADDKSFIVVNELAGAGDRGAVAVGERRILDDNGDFREAKDGLDGGKAILFTLGVELLLGLLGGIVKVVFVDGLPLGGGDENDFFDAGGETFFDDELNHGAVAYR